jgi:hypothetical protein
MTGQAERLAADEFDDADSDETGEERVATDGGEGRATDMSDMDVESGAKPQRETSSVPPGGKGRKYESTSQIMNHVGSSELPLETSSRSLNAPTNLFRYSRSSKPRVHDHDDEESTQSESENRRAVAARAELSTVPVSHYSHRVVSTSDASSGVEQGKEQGDEDSVRRHAKPIPSVTVSARPSKNSQTGKVRKRTVDLNEESFDGSDSDDKPLKKPKSMVTGGLAEGSGYPRERYAASTQLRELRSGKSRQVTGSKSAKDNDDAEYRESQREGRTSSAHHPTRLMTRSTVAIRGEVVPDSQDSFDMKW